MKWEIDCESVCVEQQQYLIGQTKIAHFLGQSKVFHAHYKDDLIDLTQLGEVSSIWASAAEAYVQPKAEVEC